MKKREIDDYALLEADLRSSYQGRKMLNGRPDRTGEEELLRYLASIQPKKPPKKKKNKNSASVKIRLERQEQERAMARRELTKQMQQEQMKRKTAVAPENKSVEEPIAKKRPQNKILEGLSVEKIPAERKVQIPKSERELLLENPNKRYVLEKNSILAHDRSCTEIAAIPDNNFAMTEAFPTDRWFCDRCYFRALIRNGLSEGQEDRMERYYGVFQALQVEGGPLRKLMLGCKARLYDADSDRIFLRAGEERWLLVAEQQQCQLYEIVSREDKQTGKVYSRLRQDVLGDFEEVVLRIEQYPLEKKRQESMKIQRRVLGTRNVRRVRCISVLYRYYIYADCLRQHRALGWKWGFPMKVMDIQEYPDSGFTTVVCRIRRRDEWLFMKAMKDMKYKSLAIDGNAYADFCNAHLPTNDKQRLLAVLQGKWRKI